MPLLRASEPARATTPSGTDFGTSVNQVVNVQVQNQQPRKRWSSVIAALLSFIIPGAGQMYKGQPINGILWFVVVVVGYFFFIIPGVILHLLCILGAALGDPYR